MVEYILSALIKDRGVLETRALAEDVETRTREVKIIREHYRELNKAEVSVSYLDIS